MSAQAFHYLHRRCSLALKARCQRAEAALRKKAVVRGNAKAEVAAGVLDLPVKPFVVHRHAAEDKVGVDADVLCNRLDNDVGARKRVVYGKSVYVRVEIGDRGIIKENR